MTGRMGQRGSDSWPKDETSELLRLWDLYGGGITKIARAMGKTRGQISGKSRILGLQFHGSRVKVAKPEILEAGRSIYHRRVRQAEYGVLKSGDNQRKLGAIVTKGDWKDMPIFSLTLEERATCSRTCAQWAGCYGNNMGLAVRYAPGPALEKAVELDLVRIRARARKGDWRGWVVRLHILGDFYSVEYVHFWLMMLARFPLMRVFGYTAWQRGTPIGDAIAEARDHHWRRFAIRTSGAPYGEQPRTIVVDREPVARPRDGMIVCPAQLSKTKNCGSCALCWADAARHRTICFLQH